MLLSLAVAFAQLGGAETGVTGEQVREILDELRQIRLLLEKEGARYGPIGPARNVKTAIDVGSAPFLGAKNAPLTIVEFTDFQCPYCNRFFEGTFPLLKGNYIDSGKLRFYSMDLPLEIHSNAMRAAQAGRCAGEQGQFWPMHDRMQGNPSRLNMEDLLSYAIEIGINVPAFHQCIESQKYKEAIVKEAREATAKGARGTPAFVIGKSTPSGVEGEVLVGTQPYGVFEERLKTLIIPQIQ
jgi:protein-disulfide isomerase